MTDAGIQTIPDVLTASAEHNPDVTAIVCEGRSLSYSELLRRSRMMATLLAKLDVRPGDRVAWIGRSSESWFELFMGAAMARAVLTPVNARLAEPEIAYILEDSAAQLLFVTPDHLEIARQAVSLAPRTVRLLVLEPGRPAYEAGGHMTAADLPLPPREPQPDDHLVMIYTSGTTGRPKGVCLSNRNYAAFANLRRNLKSFDYQPGDVLLLLVPLFHVAGCNMVLAGLASGAKIVLHPEFSPVEVARSIQRERIKHIFLAPVMIGAILSLPDLADYDFSSLETLSYGSSAIPAALLAKALATFGCEFAQFYGMTESVGAGTTLTAQDHVPARLQSCGRAWPGLEVRITSPEGVALGPNVTGEIEIRGDVVMAGYWRQPEATAQTVRPDRWLRTGDAGYIDEQGFVYVRDRVKDMIVSGGENIYPVEVENAIGDCPGVMEVAVIGVPDDQWGEAVKAIVVAAPNAALTAGDIIDWARQKIAGYKLPKSVEFVSALPRNPSGKVLKRELRRPYWEGRERQVN